MSQHAVRRPRSAHLLALAAALTALLCSAATPGDIGGCGQPAEELDARVFYSSLQATDCRACRSCGVTSATCDAACDSTSPTPGAFPTGCAPLAHDGEVCLRRLQEADCDEYAPIVADGASGVVSLTSRPRPTECQFCPAR